MQRGACQEMTPHPILVRGARGSVGRSLHGFSVPNAVANSSRTDPRQGVGRGAREGASEEQRSDELRQGARNGARCSSSRRRLGVPEIRTREQVRRRSLPPRAARPRRRAPKNTNHSKYPSSGLLKWRAISQTIGERGCLRRPLLLRELQDIQCNTPDCFTSLLMTLGVCLSAVCLDCLRALSCVNHARAILVPIVPSRGSVNLPFRRSQFEVIKDDAFRCKRGCSRSTPC